MISDQIEKIKELMEYGVPEKYLQDAFDVLEELENDIIVLNLFHSFYSYLPEGVEDWISELRLIQQKEGLFLICAVASQNEYLYLVNQEKAEFIGPLQEGIYDTDIIDFFDITDENGKENFSREFTDYPPYTAAYENKELCPVCSTADGGYHTLGCPVEICPWCGGQLTGCNCRFTILEKDQISSEKDLQKFEEMLTEKGRIAYDAINHRPGYPSQE